MRRCSGFCCERGVDIRPPFFPFLVFFIFFAAFPEFVPLHTAFICLSLSSERAWAGERERERGRGSRTDYYGAKKKKNHESLPEKGPDRESSARANHSEGKRRGRSSRRLESGIGGHRAAATPRCSWFDAPFVRAGAGWRARGSSLPAGAFGADARDGGGGPGGAVRKVWPLAREISREPVCQVQCANEAANHESAGSNGRAVGPCRSKRGGPGWLLAGCRLAGLLQAGSRQAGGRPYANAARWVSSVLERGAPPVRLTARLSVCPCAEGRG